MDTIFRKIIISIMFIFFFLTGFTLAQNGYKTVVKLTDLPDETLLQKMQTNATELLTEINNSFFQDRKPELNNGIIIEDAGQILNSLWETSPFRCYETLIIERVLQMQSDNGKKYQVRNIPVFIKDVFEANDDTLNLMDNNHYQEICLTFNSGGVIENIFYSLEANTYQKLLNEGITVSDIRRRAFILDFVENFRTAYNRKDINYLQKVYSDDALIITGKVIKTKPSDMINSLSGVQIEYQKQSKKEYINKLKDKIFKYNKYINILFEEIKITQDRVYPDIYGVTLKQYWNTTNYKDVGYLFLMIDFKDENNPIIHVRTWQPEDAKLTKEGVFTLNSFELVR